MKILSALRITAAPALVFAFVLASALTAHARQFAAGELTDPATGVRWVLLRDTAHPDAPGRWVLSQAAARSGDPSGKKDGMFFRPQPPVIRSGDRIVLVEHSAIADVRLAALALTSAAKGETLRARIAIGGAVVTARADGKGLAELGPAAAGSMQAGLAEAWR